MLPMPGSPSSSWALYRERLTTRLRGADTRVFTAFWSFGLINNIFYVIILTAALDLVGPSIPKATVLVASIVPSLIIKAVAPYFIHLIPYSLRIIAFAALSTCGMLAVALSPDTKSPADISSKIAGICIASLSSGAGEVTFLGLTHFYGPTSLAAWGSGTGGAGLIGAGAYALATTTLGISIRGTLMSSTLLTIAMLLMFFACLPLGPLQAARRQEREYHRVEEDDIDAPSSPLESANLLSQPSDRPISPAYTNKSRMNHALHNFKIRLLRVKSLVIPYMLPLFLVYLAEYTINQGLAPVLLFPISQSPFAHFRDFYPTYGAIYQLGVFISRSSLPFIRIQSLYIPTFLQVLNLAVLTAQALFSFIPSVWLVFAIIFWEGLLGGLVYVSTFARIREDIREEEREFSLGATSVSDSGGIFIASILGMIMETTLCQWQVDHGKDWCRQL